LETGRWLEEGEPTTIFQIGGRRGVTALLGLSLLAGWTGHPFTVFLIVALLATLGIAKLWAQAALRDVGLEQHLPESRAFPDERLRLIVSATNDKLLPLPWLRFRSAIPPALTPVGAPRRWPYVERGGYVQALSALSGRSQVRWEFELHCRRRGAYEIGPVELTSGDPFGFLVRRRVSQKRLSVIVYPRIQPLRQLGFPLSSGFGFALRRRALQEDSSRAAGLRAYQHGDPLRRMHWKATARHAELLVRTFDPAASPRLLLVLGCDTFNFPWTRYREDLFELAVSALASIAWRALEDGWQVGLLINGPRPARLPPASSPRQLDLILEALARAEAAGDAPIDQVFAEQAVASRATTIVIAAGRGTIPLNTALERLRAARGSAILLYGDEPPTAADRLPRYRLRQWDDLAATLEGAGEHQRPA
jgi:uncharacterized protein (DUF58 family)